MNRVDSTVLDMYGNNYGAWVESSDMEPFQTPKPRKRRKHGLGKETGRQFRIGRGEDVTSACWSLLEKLLCIECTLNMENMHHRQCRKTDCYLQQRYRFSKKWNSEMFRRIRSYR